MSSWAHPSFIPDQVPRSGQLGLEGYSNSQAHPYAQQSPYIGPSHDAAPIGFGNRELPHSPSLDLIRVPSSTFEFDPSLNMSRSLSASSEAQSSTPLCFATQSSLQVEGDDCMTMQQQLYSTNSTNTCSTPFMGLARSSAPKLPGNEQILAGESWSTQPRHIEPELESAKLSCGWTGCASLKGFSRRGSLWRHIQDQHLPPGISCPMCSKTFRRKDKYKIHLRHAHSDIARDRDEACCFANL